MQRPVVLNLCTGLDETLCLDATLPRSHSVLGSAPVIMNTCWMPRISLAPGLVLCSRTLSRCVSPFKRFDCRPSHKSNARTRFDSGNQVSRHGFGKARSSHH
jgi:hypothetical protein